MKREIDWAVIIPTWREEGYIGRVLDSLSAQTSSPKEIVVVDALSDDGTLREILRRRVLLPQLTVIQIPRSTIARQRNAGVARTSTSHVLFLDADTVPAGLQTLEQYQAEVQRRRPDIALLLGIMVGLRSDQLGYNQYLFVCFSHRFCYFRDPD